MVTEKVKDKIAACWAGKNIGGTLGTPYEGDANMHDIQGFASKKGEPLPNDDLDLQLIWLMAVDESWPEIVNSATLGEYWLSDDNHGLILVYRSHRNLNQTLSRRLKNVY